MPADAMTCLNVLQSWLSVRPQPFDLNGKPIASVKALPLLASFLDRDLSAAFDQSSLWASRRPVSREARPAQRIRSLRLNDSVLLLV